MKSVFVDFVVVLFGVVDVFPVVFLFFLLFVLTVTSVLDDEAEDGEEEDTG